MIADLVRGNGPEPLDREMLEAVKRTYVYEWATFGDGLDDLIEEVVRTARSDARRVLRALALITRAIARVVGRR